MPKATPALEITTDTPAPPPRKRGGKPLAVEEHTVVKKWSAEVKVDDKPKAPPKRKAVVDDAEDDIEEIDEIYSDLPEDLAAFLQANSGAKDVTMEVRRIDGPKMDVMPGIRAGVYLGNHRFDVENHQDDLALYYAEPGKDVRFMLRLKCAGQYVPNGTIYPVDVIGASVERKQAVGAPIPQTNAAPPSVALTYTAPQLPQEPIDRMAGIRETVSLLKEFQEIGLIPKLERSKEPVVVQQNPPQQQFTEEDHIIRAALSSQDAQERVSKGILGKLLGGAMAENDTPWWGDIVKDLVMSVGPGLNALLQVGAQKMMQAQATVAQNGAPVASLPPQQGEPQPQEVAPPPVQEPPQQATPEDILFAQIFGACQRRKLIKPEVCAKGVLDLVDAHAAENGYSPFTNAVEIFLSADMADIIAYAATQNPMAAKMATEEDVLPWLKAVQDEIRKEWTQQDENPNE
jgi:hypothetical protein